VCNVRSGRSIPSGGALLCVVVAAVEGVAAAVGALLALLSAGGSGSWPLGVGVAVVAAGVAYLLGRVAFAWWRGERWQRGLFATVQVLVVLVALSVGAPVLLAPAAAPTTFALVAASLVLAGAGLAGAVLAVRAAAAGDGSR
jgi:hypothetical protein